MKLTVQLLSAFIFMVLSVSCSDTAATTEKPLVLAEQAYDEGSYARAQTIADSLIASKSPDKLGAWPLCRLALLFARLGEVNGEIETNTAMAARALEAAQRCDSDSTSIFIATLPVDDRARMLLVKAVAEGSRHATDPDSLDAAVDSMMNYTEDYGY